MTDSVRSNRQTWLQLLLALVSGVPGCGLLGLCAYGLNRLLQLMEDEGTNSWTVNAGPFGIVGCVIFLAILFCFAVVFLTYATNLLLHTIKPRPRVSN